MMSLQEKQGTRDVYFKNQWNRKGNQKQFNNRKGDCCKACLQASQHARQLVCNVPVEKGKWLAQTLKCWFYWRIFLHSDVDPAEDLGYIIHHHTVRSIT